MTSSLSLFALCENVNISKTKKDIPKRKTPFFLTLKSLSIKQQLLFFYFIGTLIGPLKSYLAENISLQNSNWNILGLAATVTSFAIKAWFTQIWVFFQACSLQNEVGDPPFFYILTRTHHLSMVKFSEKNQR